MAEETPQQHTLDTLLIATKKEADEESGLDRFEDLKITDAETYRALDSDTFKFLKEQLPLTAALPKPPVLGEYQFLLSAGGHNLKDLFEDNWNTASLAYAASAEAFTSLSEYLEGEDIDKESNPVQELIRAVRIALLTSQHTLARTRDFYRYLAKRTANKTVAKPGQNRTSVIQEADAKQISTAIETKTKLQRLTQPKTRGRERGRGRQNRYWRPRNQRWGFSGRGRRGGRLTPQQPTQTSKQN